VVEVREPGGRYIDFLIPGIVGMNIMSGGMWGVGFNLVDMRIKRLLKRLVAAPMRRPDFLAANLAMRLVFMVIEVSFVLASDTSRSACPCAAASPRSSRWGPWARSASAGSASSSARARAGWRR
jgi:hypothetical protein